MKRTLFTLTALLMFLVTTAQEPTAPGNARNSPRKEQVEKKGKKKNKGEKKKGVEKHKKNKKEGKKQK